MKNALIAILLMYGVSVGGIAVACDGKDKAMSSGTTAPASPATAPAPSK